MKGYVYILKSEAIGKYYIGSSNNPDRRLAEHNANKSKFTSNKGPWERVFWQEFDTPTLAKKMEIKLKKLKNKTVLEKIINKGKFFLTEGGTINW